MKGYLYRCSCGKVCKTQLEWATHYRTVQPVIGKHDELSRSELARYIEVTLARHNDHHRLEMNSVKNSLESPTA